MHNNVSQEEIIVSCSYPQLFICPDRYDVYMNLMSCKMCVRRTRNTLEEREYSSAFLRNTDERIICLR